MNDEKSLEDFEVLKNIIEGKTKIENIDIDLKKRLIVICNKRLKKVNESIKERELEIYRMEKLISEINSFN